MEQTTNVDILRVKHLNSAIKREKPKKNSHQGDFGLLIIHKQQLAVTVELIYEG